MNLICKLLGHKWRNTSSRQYAELEGERVDCWINERTCVRCGVVEEITRILYAQKAAKDWYDKLVLEVVKDATDRLKQLNSKNSAKKIPLRSGGTVTFKRYPDLKSEDINHDKVEIPNDIEPVLARRNTRGGDSNE